MMPLYRLEPAIEYIGDEDWTASTHKAIVYVKATSEKKARETAHRKFWIGASRKTNGEVPINPWKNPEMVLCREVGQGDEVSLPQGSVLLKKDQPN